MSNAQDNAAHTCSYSCDRPECIKAQRDELAAAVAQEAVAYWRVTFRMYPENSDCCETFVRGPDRQTLDTIGISPRPVQITSMEPYFAAPVTAAPAMESMGKRKLIQLQGDGFIVNGVAIYNPDTGQRGLVDYLGYVGWQGTPAAPGIELKAFREPVAFWFEHLVTHPYTETNAARLREAKRLLALIDASPKGCSEALDAARWRAVDAASSNTTLRLHSARPGERAKVIDAAMQAQTDEAPTYTTGHCENHRRPGGCPLHNLQCGYPQCDRRQAGDGEVQP